MSTYLMITLFHSICVHFYIVSKRLKVEYMTEFLFREWDIISYSDNFTFIAYTSKIFCWHEISYMQSKFDINMSLPRVKIEICRQIVYNSIF